MKPLVLVGSADDLKAMSKEISDLSPDFKVDMGDDGTMTVSVADDKDVTAVVDKLNDIVKKYDKVTIKSDEPSAESLLAKADALIDAEMK